MEQRGTGKLRRLLYSVSAEKNHPPYRISSFTLKASSPYPLVLPTPTTIAHTQQPSTATKLPPTRIRPFQKHTAAMYLFPLSPNKPNSPHLTPSTDNSSIIPYISSSGSSSGTVINHHHDRETFLTTPLRGRPLRRRRYSSSSCSSDHGASPLPSLTFHISCIADNHLQFDPTMLDPTKEPLLTPWHNPILELYKHLVACRQKFVDGMVKEYAPVMKTIVAGGGARGRGW